MKQVMIRARNLAFLALTLLCLSLFSASAFAAVEASDEQLISAAETLTNELIAMTDEDIEDYKYSADAFTVETVTAWESSRGEAGAEKTDEEAPETTVSRDGDECTVTVTRPFENATVKFNYVIDLSRKDPAFSSCGIDVALPMGVTLGRAALNTLMGICTVFLMLVFLSFVISLFGRIPGKFEKKESPAPAKAAPSVSAAPAAEASLEDDNELIAVIAAAIAASEGTTTDGFVVRSIRKSTRARR